MLSVLTLALVFGFFYMKDTVAHNQIKLHQLDRTELLKEILGHYFLTKGNVNVIKDVGFLVYPSSYYTIPKNSPMKFDKVSRNDGKAYDASTGVFTVPTGGMYHFYWTVLSYNGKPADMNLFKNGSIVTRSFIQAKTQHENISGGAYVRLKRGDKVYLQSVREGGYLHNGPYSTFGGELIHH